MNKKMSWKRTTYGHSEAQLWKSVCVHQGIDTVKVVEQSCFFLVSWPTYCCFTICIPVQGFGWHMHVFISAEHSSAVIKWLPMECVPLSWQPFWECCSWDIAKLPSTSYSQLGNGRGRKGQNRAGRGKKWQRGVNLAGILILSPLFQAFPPSLSLGT